MRGVTAFGLPSTSAKWRFMFGNFLTACTIAYPIRWVNEILPPRVRLRWLLMTIRLSIINLAGMARTLVAVGTSSDDVHVLHDRGRRAAQHLHLVAFAGAGGGSLRLGRGGFLRGRRATPLRARPPVQRCRRGGRGRLPVVQRLGVGGRFGGVVDEEFVPTGIHRGGILAELAVHLLDQPLVLSEW